MCEREKGRKSEGGGERKRINERYCSLSFAAAVRLSIRDFAHVASRIDGYIIPANASICFSPKDVVALAPTELASSTERQAVLIFLSIFLVISRNYNRIIYSREYLGYRQSADTYRGESIRIHFLERDRKRARSRSSVAIYHFRAAKRLPTNGIVTHDGNSDGKTETISCRLARFIYSSEVFFSPVHISFNYGYVFRKLMHVVVVTRDNRWNMSVKVRAKERAASTRILDATG